MVGKTDVVEKDIYTVNGNTYHSIPEMAKAYAMSESKLRSRLLYGYSLEEAVLDQRSFRELSAKRRRLRECKEFAYDGNTYTTLQKLAIAMDVVYADVVRDFNCGYIPNVEIRDRAWIAKTGRVYKTRVFAEVDGVTYRTRKDYVDKMGLNVNIFRGYLKKNHSIEDATRLTREKQKGFWFEGKCYRSLLAVSRKAEVMYSRLITACKVTNTLEEAVLYARESAILQTRRTRRVGVDGVK